MSHPMAPIDFAALIEMLGGKREGHHGGGMGRGGRVNRLRWLRAKAWHECVAQGVQGGAAAGLRRSVGERAGLRREANREYRLLE